MIIKQSALTLICILLLCVGCATFVKPQKSMEIDDYGCVPPPPDVFRAAGIDIQFAQSTFGKLVVGDINIKTNPQVIALASQAVIDDRIRSYLRCLAIRRDEYTHEQAAYLEALSLFMQTKPNADQFLRWQKENPFPPKEPFPSKEETSIDSQKGYLPYSIIWVGSEGGRKMVLINVGKNEGIKMGDELRVYTKENSLEEIGQIEVLSVFEDKSKAEVIKEGAFYRNGLKIKKPKTIKPGDKVRLITSKGN